MQRRVALSGALASLASAAAALAASALENGRAAPPLNAITHIYDGGEPPPAHDGHNRRNTVIGFAIHTAASVWWALFYEGLFGRASRRSAAHALAAGAAIAASAYVVDYHVVPRRLRPGFEAYLSGRGLAAVYCALALGFAAASLLTRRR